MSREALLRLQNEAALQLENILTQEQIVREYQSSVTIILNRLQRNRSFFDNISFSYASMRWWSKPIIFILVSLTSVAMGYLLNLLLVLPLVVFFIYVLCICLFENHYHSCQHRDIQLQDDIQRFEASLAEAVEHLLEIEQQLKSVIASLCKLNLQQLDNVSYFKRQVDDLEEQVLSLKFILEAMAQAKNLIDSSSMNVIQSLSRLSTISTHLAQEIEQCSNISIQQPQVLSKNHIDILNLLQRTVEEDRLVYAGLVEQAKDCIELLKTMHVQGNSDCTSSLTDSSMDDFLDRIEADQLLIASSSLQRQEDSATRADDIRSLLIRSQKCLEREISRSVNAPFNSDQ